MDNLSWLRTSWFRFIITDIATQNGIVPEVFGYEKCNEKKATLQYDKNCYSLHFVISGEGKVDNIKLKEGDAFILTPHCNLKYNPNQKNPWEYVWVEFNGYLAERFVRHAGFVDDNFILRNLTCFESILDLFRKVFLEAAVLTNKHAKTMFFESYTTEMLGLLTQEKGYEITYRQKSISEVNMQKILRYIDTHYSNPDLSVSSIAEEFFYVPSYLTRLFKKYASVNPSKYITQIRLEKSVDLLANKELSIEQISILVGYKNPFYFSKEFKRRYGVPPSKYIDKD
jgi:YesN/AraC family two-component response regulator